MGAERRNRDVTDREVRIRERAYALWERAGRPEGSHDEHWQAAEREIDAEHGASDAADGAAHGSDDAGRDLGGKAVTGSGPGGLAPAAAHAAGELTGGTAGTDEIPITKADAAQARPRRRRKQGVG